MEQYLYSIHRLINRWSIKSSRFLQIFTIGTVFRNGSLLRYFFCNVSSALFLFSISVRSNCLFFARPIKALCTVHRSEECYCRLREGGGYARAPLLISFSVTGTVLMWHVSVVCSGRIVYIYFVKKLEAKFLEKDGLMEEVMDCFIISVGGIDSREEGSNSEYCSSDSELAFLLCDWYRVI